jgi:hypothetical protein
MRCLALERVPASKPIEMDVDPDEGHNDFLDAQCGALEAVASLATSL